MFPDAKYFLTPVTRLGAHHHQFQNNSHYSRQKTLWPVCRGEEDHHVSDQRAPDTRRSQQRSFRSRTTGALSHYTRNYVIVYHRTTAQHDPLRSRVKPTGALKRVRAAAFRPSFSSASSYPSTSFHYFHASTAFILRDRHVSQSRHRFR